VTNTTSKTSSASPKAKVTVMPVPKVVSFTNATDNTITAGMSVGFANTTSGGTGNNIFTYFVNGAPVAPNSNGSITFLSVGMYNVSLGVKDSSGEAANSVNATVTVNSAVTTTTVSNGGGGGTTAGGISGSGGGGAPIVTALNTTTTVNTTSTTTTIPSTTAGSTPVIIPTTSVPASPNATIGNLATPSSPTPPTSGANYWPEGIIAGIAGIAAIGGYGAYRGAKHKRGRKG
jgi:hypothetical protein